MGLPGLFLPKRREALCALEKEKKKKMSLCNWRKNRRDGLRAALDLIGPVEEKGRVKGRPSAQKKREQ